MVDPYFEAGWRRDGRRILGENAIEVYGLDRQALAAVAERIGPDSSELFHPDAHRAVAPALVDDFNRRNRIEGNAETVDTSALEAAIDEDLEILAGAH